MAEKYKLEVKNLVKKFGDLLVLDDISFNVRENEFLCIVGPTGCGKTTFLNSLSKLYDITSGEILINGEPVNLKKHNIAYIFQEYSNMPWLTIRQNVEFGLRIKRLPEDVIKERADYFLNMVGLMPTVRQHAPARCDCPRVRSQAGGTAHGRALRSAGHRAALPP